MLTSWNINMREPVLFSKKMKEIHKNSQYDGLSMNEMVYASASDPLYFSAAGLSYKDSYNSDVSNQYIGGTMVAQNPAMYAYILATDFLKIDPSKITVTTVGDLEF